MRLASRTSVNILSPMITSSESLGGREVSFDSALFPGSEAK